MTLWIKILVSGFCFLTGAVVGSFLNVCIWRLPRGQSVIRPASRCPACGGRISASDNIPLVSYFLLQRRCRRCGQPISARYPLVEALAGAMAVVLFLSGGPTLPGLRIFVLFCLLLVVACADLDRMTIPDAVTLPGVILGLALNGLTAPGTILTFVLGAVVGGVALLLVAIVGELLFKKESMGGGDIKLAAMVGAFVGWPGVLMALFVAVLGGALVGLALILSGLRTRHEVIPFGPFIATGALVVVFWGDGLVRAYRQLFLL